MTKRKEEALKKYPGISKILEWNSKLSRWQDSGKFRAMRRTDGDDGFSKKESGFFDSFEQAKDFRLGKIEKHETGNHHKNVMQDKLRFSALVKEWKDFHYLTIDFTTQQTYDKKLPALEFLSSFAVDEISPSVIDQMIRHWHAHYPLKRARFSFDKELDTLKVVLNYYRRRLNPMFPVPVFKEHYQAAQVVKRATCQVRSLRTNDLGKFFRALKGQKNPIYFSIALTQFGLGLRIGEACGLHWKAIDFENGIATIEHTIVWDQENWEAKIKHRPKNGRIRFLVVPEVLLKEFASLKAQSRPEHQLIFHQAGEPLIRKTVGNAYNRALKACGIDYVSGTHLMRKTSATQANRVTGDFHAVSKSLGHASLEETQKYVEEVDDGKRKVAKALDQVACAFL